MKELKENLKLFQNLLIDISTSGNHREKEENYWQLRETLIENDKIKNQLPKFVMNCRDAAQFWQYIKDKFKTYAERKNYLWHEFETLFKYFDENKNMSKIFISHSSEDATKIKPLVDLIENIGILPDQIFFSSHPAYGVNLGENIFERLKLELEENIFALFILSENFYKSPVCLCEMGAVWIKSNKQIPILIPPFDFIDIKGVFPNSLGFKINDKRQLNTFKTVLESYFNLEPISFTRWEEKRDDYLSKINELLK